MVSVYQLRRWWSSTSSSWLTSSWRLLCCAKPLLSMLGHTNFSAVILPYAPSCVTSQNQINMCISFWSPNTTTGCTRHRLYLLYCNVCWFQSLLSTLLSIAFGGTHTHVQACLVRARFCSLLASAHGACPHDCAQHSDPHYKSPNFSWAQATIMVLQCCAWDSHICCLSRATVHSCNAQAITCW